MQEALIVLIFSVAVFYVSRKIYLDFASKSDCPKGCGACDLSEEPIK